MRNLRNTRHDAVQFKGQHLTASAFDLDDIICCSGPTEDSPTITLDKRSGSDIYDVGRLVASWDAPSPAPALLVDRVISLHCLSDERIITLVLEGGDIIVVRQDAQSDQDRIEIVGSVDVGILAAVWSPDDELLAIATKANTVLFMTRDFEPAASITLAAEDIKVSSHVSVGWGKKETQFTGRGARALRDPTVPEHVDEGSLNPDDDSRVSISWRGDGQYVAINSVLGSTPDRRVIRVYTRDGALDSVSEAVNGLQSALSWKPSGQLIAGARKHEHGVEIVFFERNGLRHGEFDLRLSKEEFESLHSDVVLNWNVDSTVLAVSYADRVQLWTTNNYHYYLKQDVNVTSTPLLASTQLTWHPEAPLQLICSTGAALIKLEYCFAVSRGSLSPPNDIGLVAVIDGKALKITPLRTANVPPPMALEEIELSAAFVDVAFNNSGTKLAALCSDRTVAVLTCDSKVGSKWVMQEVHDLRAADSAGTTMQAVRQISFDGNDDWIVLCESFAPSNSSLRRRRADIEYLERHVVTICSTTTSSDILYESDAGEVFKKPSVGPGVLVATLPTVCPTFDAWQASDGLCSYFGVTSNGVLHAVNDARSSSIPGCTSFLVTPSHLIFTTTQHLLKFVHLQEDSDLQIPADEPEKDERCRNVERGARLVTAMPSAYSLVLQMPRGNLETIYPRALVLAGIRQSVTNRDYKKAFLTCRTHRVDMNILHDFAPDQFLRDVELFVKQVKKPEHIDLFLSSLSDDDVTQSIYKDTLLSSSHQPTTNGDHAVVSKPQTSASKTNGVCSAFLIVLAKQGDARLQNIITAHVSMNPPDLQAGLALVSRLREYNKQEDMERAVDHICFLADVNLLYDTALGLYDIDVALLVAQQSQKDPREYLPYLQGVQDLPRVRQHYTIDNDLKRYGKALEALHELDEFEELKSYVAKHELHSVAMTMYRYDNARLNQLMRMFADFLSSRNRYKDAAIAYEYVQDFASASEAYKAASMWRECLTAAMLVPVSDDELTNVASNLADSFEEAKDFRAAATIQLEYLHDLNSAVRLLCKCYEFAEAMRLIITRRQPELLSSSLDPGLIEGAASMTELLTEMKTQLGAQIPRLREVRQIREEDPIAFLDGGDGDEGDIPDNLSLAPTNASTTGTFMTRYTNRTNGTLATNATRKTSKNRRREERKRARGKKGTVYEEEYLVNSITRLIERLNAVSEEVARLVECLMRRSMRERAIAVQVVMQNVTAACKECMEEVFPPKHQDVNGQTEDQQGDPAASGRPWGGQGVLWEAMAATTSTRLDAPVLKEMQGLSLIQ